jgi:pyridoxamine 5'-phosphate oxidase
MPMGIADRRSQYESTPLDLADVDPDPIVQWVRWYEAAAETGCVEPNAMALATVDAAGHPDCRFVLVRGADARGFLFFSNEESTKGEQLDAFPWACLTFGWMEQHRQVRIRGRVERIDDAESDAYYATRPRGSQVAAWASKQSRPLTDRAALEAAVAEVEARYAGVDLPRPPYWGGYRVVPGEVEFWQGRPFRLHDRLLYRRDPSGSGWTITRLWP